MFETYCMFFVTKTIISTLANSFSFFFQYMYCAESLLDLFCFSKTFIL